MLLTILVHAAADDDIVTIAVTATNSTGTRWVLGPNYLFWPVNFLEQLISLTLHELDFQYNFSKSKLPDLTVTL